MNRPTEVELHPSYLSPTEFHPVLRVGARVISALFHPLFVPVYIIWFLLYPAAVFPGFSSWDKGLLLLRFLVLYTVFPLATILLLKGLGFVQNFYLRTQKDRIIPYVACGLYYFWMWYVLRNQPQFPRTLVIFCLAIFLASSLGLILNSYLKISMHAISMGVMIAFIYLLSFHTDAAFGLYISGAVFIAGLVCTARLINSDHHPREVWLGLGVGVLGQLVAYWFL